MTKGELVILYREFLRVTNLGIGDARVGAGGAMVLHDLRRTTNDIDMELTEEALESVIKRFHLEPTDLGEGRVLYRWNALIDLHSIDTMEGSVTFNETITSAPLKDVLELKEALNRPKDQEDIQVLKEALKRPYTYCKINLP